MKGLKQILYPSLPTDCSKVQKLCRGLQPGKLCSASVGKSCRLKRCRRRHQSKSRVLKASQNLDSGSFVQHFRQATPYIVGHRDKKFVVVIPGEVIARDDLLTAILEDLALLHGMGVGLVIVLGSSCFITAAMEKMGREPQFVAGYRVTEEAAIEAAIDAAARARTKVEGFFSRSPPVPLVRRHEKSGSEYRHFSGIGVVSGNYVVAKRRGIVGGVDFGYTGEVRSVLHEDIAMQIKRGNLVLLTNLGYSAHGHVLNCNVYDVGLFAAIELAADKIFCMHLDDVAELNLPHWLPLSDAYALIGGKPPHISQAHEGNGAHQASSNGGRKVDVDLRALPSYDIPRSVLISVIACDQGTKRAHLVNAEVDGSLLLESYTPNGIGTMISTDFYQGIRHARPSDMKDIQELLEPLVRQGITVKMEPEELAEEIPHFRVFVQDDKVLGCALLRSVGVNDLCEMVTEVAAFCIHPSIRGQGKGDTMLDYIEQDARMQGIRRLILLTTQTADWFAQRGFVCAGNAKTSPLLPVSRRAKISSARKSQLYVKEFEDLDDALMPSRRWVAT